MASSIELFDIVISFDTTASMYACLETVKGRMRDIMRKLKTDIPGIHLGVIAHGDYDSHTYVIQFENLTNDLERLSSFVTNAGGTPGYTTDEAYELSLNYARQKMSWRDNANKILVMIGDSRPHEKDFYMNIDNIDWTQEICYLRDMDVKIYAVQCEKRSYADSFYHTIASTTFGHHVELTDFKKIEDILMGICYREAGLNQIQSLASFSLPSIASPMIPSPLTIPSHAVSGAQSSIGTSVGETSDNEDSDEEQLGLICPMCKVGKLAGEYPPFTVSMDCCHASLVCLRCVMKYVAENGSCPQDGCEVPVDPACQNMKLFQAILDRMFVDYNKVLEQSKLASRPEGDVISVATMTGDTEWFPYVANMSIAELKKKIGSRLKLKPEQQRLVYNETNLKANMRLSDYAIPKNAILSLILPLYCIPEHLDHVVFDLSWEFPAINPDFLDASCMAFNNTEFVQVIDWNHPTDDYFMKGSVAHSEKNLTGHGAKTGHQTIHVYLKKVPTNITHLYFVLSSWRSPNLSAFHNPSLKFYDASSENIDLCETTFTHALHSQAVIMCSVVRVSGRWQIFECGTRGLGNGNAKRYNPIRQRIAEMIDSE